MMRPLLHASAAVLAGAGGVLVAPVAMSFFGATTGVILTGAGGLGLLASWHLVFTKKAPLVRLTSLCAAGLLSYASFSAINAGAELDAKAAYNAKASSWVTEQQALYDEREAALKDTYDKEMAAWQDAMTSYRAKVEIQAKAVERLGRELKATKKIKQPEIYSDLLAQYKEATATTETPARPVRGQPEPVGEYPAYAPVNIIKIQSLAFEIFVPLLLWLSVQFPAIKTPFRHPSDTLQTPFRHPSDTLARNSTGCLISSEIFTKGSDLLDTHKRIFLEKYINEGGQGITIKDVQTYANIGKDKARELREEAYLTGLLYTTGMGRGARYWYASYNIDGSDNQQNTANVSTSTANSSEKPKFELVKGGQYGQ